ncbi:MAG: hypothetical protein LBM04_02550 [Opitutaceae bacterium]|jgi:hypothetical protein|nr:hypothetical protein [Opitutaceae bacterium]
MEWPFEIYDPDKIKVWIRRLGILAAVILVILWWRHEPDAKWPGIPAPDDPGQTAGDLPPPFVHNGYTITPLAHYAITAVVLARDRYRFDTMSGICPVDLGLGWGPMSDAERINLMDFYQSYRWMDWRVSAKNKSKLGLSPSEVNRHAANTHCIPADAAIKKTLLSVKRHDLVTLKGYLIRANNSKNSFLSSLSRTDTGAGACEIVFVTEIQREHP